MAQSTNAERVRNILVLGTTGAGKSYFLNGVTGSKVHGETASLRAAKPPPGFSDADGPKPHVVNDCYLDSQDEGKSEKPYVVNYYDTPGIGDTENKTLEYLDIIMNLIKKVPFHQIFFVYNSQARLTEVERKNFVILKHCLNRLNAYSCTLVLNKVEEEIFGSVSDLVDFRDQLNSIFASDGFEFENCLVIKYDKSKDRHFTAINLLRPRESRRDQGNLDASKGIKEVMQIRYYDFLLASNTPFDSKSVSTWTELKNTYFNKEQSQINDQERAEKKKSTRARIDQIESEMFQLVASVGSFEETLKDIKGVDWSKNVGMIGTISTLTISTVKKIAENVQASESKVLGLACLAIVAAGAVGTAGYSGYLFYEYNRNQAKLKILQEQKEQLERELSNQNLQNQQIQETRAIVKDLAYFESVHGPKESTKA